MAEEFRTMTGSGDVFGAEAPARMGTVAGSSGQRGLPGGRNTLVVGGMVLLALGCVWLLSRGAKPSQAADPRQTLIEQQVETAVKAFDATGKADPKSAVRAEDVAKSFYYQADQRQIPASRLQGNPFVYRPPTARAVPSGPTTRPTEPAEAAVPKRVTKLVLQSVLIGREPAAMISNNLLTRGQTIEGWTLVEVNARSVVLEGEGRRQTLSMPD